MAIYRKCHTCGRVWIVSIQQAGKRGKYECPDCEEARNKRDRERAANRASTSDKGGTRH